MESLLEAVLFNTFFLRLISWSHTVRSVRCLSTEAVITACVVSKINI